MAKRQSMLPILLEYVTQQAWNMHLPVLQRMVALFENHCNGVEISADKVTEIVALRDERSATVDAQVDALQTSGDTAIISIDGVIAKYSRMVNNASQPRGTSLETLGAQLDAALSDDNVKSIFLRIESPGGSNAGLADFGDRIFQATMQKPVIAFADDLAASAAFWLGSQASRFYANQTAFVGNIGTYTVMVDSSEAALAEGFKVTIVKSGVHKGVGVQGVAITDEHLKDIQGLIDDSNQLFLDAVMRGRGDRGLTPAALADFSDGRLVKPTEAKAAGLIDGIMTLAQAFNVARPNPRPQQELNTNTLAASAVADTQQSSKTSKELQMDTPTDQAADNTAAAKQAVEADRVRTAAISTALGVHPSLSGVMATAIQTGQTVIEAKAAGFDILQTAHAEEMTAKNAELAETEGRLKTTAEKGENNIEANDAPDAGSEAGSTSSDSADAAAYDKVVTAHVAGGMTRSKAYNAATKSHPLAHQAWIAADTAANTGIGE